MHLFLPHFFLPLNFLLTCLDTALCDLPTGPAQIRSWYPQGPEGSITLLEIAKPLFLSPQDFLTEGISTFNERLLQVFPICCYSLAVTMGRRAFRRRHPLVSDCSTQSDCGGCWRNSTRVRRLGNLLGEEKRRSHPRVRRNGAASVTLASSSHHLPVTQHKGRDWLNAEKVFSVSPSPQLCRCLPERRCVPMHRRRQHSVWSEPSPPGGTARLGIGTPRRWHPLSSGPTSAWRQPSLSANLCSRQKLLRASEALTDSSSSTGPLCSPARTIERSQEGTRGGLGRCNLLAPLRNLTMRSCFPRNRPSTAS